MQVRDKINYMIEERKMSKTNFAEKLLTLEPKLNSTGKSPSLSTVYGYLNGRREIKIELIPYIAEVLNIKEQELFEFDIEYATEFNYMRSKEVREVISLLQFVPVAKIIELKDNLTKFKELASKDLV